MISLVSDIWNVLPTSLRRRLVLVGLLSVVSAMLELVGIGLVVPILAMVANPELAAEAARKVPILAGMLPPDQARIAINGLGAIIVVYAFKSGVQLALTWYQTDFAFRSEGSLSMRLLEKYLRQPWVFHLQRNSATLFSVIRAEPYNVSFLLLAAVALLADVAAITGVVALMAIVEPIGTIAITGLLAIVVTALFTLVKNRLTKWGELRQVFDTQRHKEMYEAIGSVREIQLMGCESIFTERYRRAMEGYSRVVHRVALTQHVPRIVLEPLAIVAIALLVVVSIWLGRSLIATLPVIAMFAAAATRLLPAFNRVAGSAQTIRACRPSLDKVMQELQLVEQEARGEQPEVRALTDSPIDEALRFEHVEFRYPGANRLAISSLDLTIPHGQMVGVIGTSGSGKSTMMDLMLGLLKPTAGRISLGGIDIHQNLPAWRRTIGYVPQNIVLIDNTLRRNIAFGVPDHDIDEAAVRNAVRAARLDDFVSLLPAGLDTEIGERGARLSGGQRQRIGIARALYRDPRIIVLDEATSALDNQTENEVMEAINNLHGAKTIVIVAHRLSTIDRCDRVVRLETGRIVEESE